MKQCIKCGQELEDFAVFCSECGESQIHNNENNNPQPEEINNKAEICCADTAEPKTDKPEAAEQSYKTSSAQPKNTIDEQIPDKSSKTVKIKKPFSKLNIISLTIIVLLIATSAFMSIMYFSQKSEFSDYKIDSEKQISELENEYNDLKSDYNTLKIRCDLLADERDKLKEQCDTLRILNAGETRRNAN